MQENNSTGGGPGPDEVAPRRLRKAETVLGLVTAFPRPFTFLHRLPSTCHRLPQVLSRRTSRVIVVIEGSYDLHNQAAVLRTAECLGVQHAWLVDAAVGETVIISLTLPPHRY